jgi:cell division protein FtsI/penicillin-binding protein 2
VQHGAVGNRQKLDKALVVAAGGNKPVAPGRKLETLDEPLVFVAGVLDREPRIAMCIFLEHRLHGSTAAAPVAKQVIEYFRKK